MSRNVSMGTLVTSCQREADAEGDPSIAPPEWKRWISQQYAALYSIVVNAGLRYFEATNIFAANGATSYSLPADHDEYIGVDRAVDLASDNWTELGEIMVQERNRYGGFTGDATGFAVVGQGVMLYPRPTTGTYRLVYVPQSPDISSLADSSNVDVVTGDGEALLVWGVAVRGIGKLRRDPSLAMTERNMAEARFSEDVKRRALVNPRRRVVVRPPFGSVYDDDGPLTNDPASWSWRYR